jgi:signal transduction histidine kinase/ActR/RegA family two-component response regulator
LATVINNGKSGSEVMQHTGNISAEEFAPRLAWSEMGESEHFVQFYEADVSLLDSLAGYITTGLSAGDACIVVTTHAHREALEERLKASGLDIAAAKSSGQYVPLDAAETLTKFMVDGRPEPGRFIEVMGGILARAAATYKRVRAFGEMVALLWTEGNHDGAIQLEGLWNDLQSKHAFSLFCAYEMSCFGGEDMVEPFSKVCTGHSSVIPSESYTNLATADDRLRAIIKLQQQARTLQAEIDERKEVEERLRVSLIREQMARAEAENASRLKDEFLATVSHELRTPLHAVIGWAHMLRTGGLDAQTAARAIETIERNAKSQAQLVEDILDVSRVMAGKLRLTVAPVDAASVINAAIDSIELAAESKNIQLEVMLDPSARRVSGDAGRLQQAVWNLLSNAIKFTPRDGRVAVRLERAGADALISVSDTGEGIHQDFLPFIFDRFRQADGTSTRRHGGLGLGLAIVRQIVELHGGTVHGESGGKGLGSTFTIRLPLAAVRERARGLKQEDEPLQPPPSVDERVVSLPSLDGVQVLIVDDDEDTRSMLTVMLTEHKAKVQVASSAAGALEILQWYRPDVLVTDLAMPGEDGYSLIGKVRRLEGEKGQKIPAIALTAYVRVEDRTRALSAGFNMFVPKPVEPGELITTIANLARPDLVN